MRLDELHTEILEGLSDEAKRDFEAGLKALSMGNPADRAALRESIRKLRPDFTEAQITTFVEGETKAAVDLEESFVKLGLTRQQAGIAAKGAVRGMGYSEPIPGGGREALIASLKYAHPDWTDQQIENFIAGR